MLKRKYFLVTFQSLLFCLITKNTYVSWNFVIKVLKEPRFTLMSSVTAVVEHIRDGCTVRAFVLPSFHYITVMLSGIKVSDALPLTGIRLSSDPSFPLFPSYCCPVLVFLGFS